MPVEVEPDIQQLMDEAGFPLSHVVTVGPKGSRVRIAVTCDLMDHRQLDESTALELQELSDRVTIDRVVVPYFPPASIDLSRFAPYLKRLSPVELVAPSGDRDQLFRDFFILQGIDRETVVIANLYSDALLRKMGKLFHIVLADIAAPSYDSEYGRSSFGTQEAMAFEDRLVQSAIAKLSSREVAIDLGCGTGRHTFELARHFDRVEGFDFSSGMIDVANAKKRALDLEEQLARNVSFAVRDVEDFPLDFEAETIDLVAGCFGMGSFVDDLVRFLTNIKDQLRPGGKTVLSFYNREAMPYSVPPPWRDCALSATLIPEREELQVTLPMGDKFRIFCRAYSLAEIKGQLSRIFDSVQIVSGPTFASFLPNEFFVEGPRGERARNLISHIDRELSQLISFPVGAYFTAVCSKATLDVGKGLAIDRNSGMGEEELLRLLQEAGVEFEVLEHARVRNTSDVQRQLAISPTLMAKAILVLVRGEGGADEGNVVFVVPGSHRLDLAKASTVLGRNRRKWRFATQKEVRRLYGLEIGGVPPLGYGLDVPVFFDRRLAGLQHVYCGSGNPEKTVKLHASDLIRISGAVLCDIASDP